MNYKFNIDEWLPMFPLKEKYDRYTGYGVTSPFHVCNNVQLRRELDGQIDWGDAVPVDIFVMSAGEPEDRACTKVGGLPYRPKGLPWPKGSQGDSMRFLAQFNFRDSKDIVDNLLGELLLVFGDDSGGPFDSLHFEWWNEGLSEVIDSNEIPDPPTPFLPCFGQVYRTVSFPKAHWELKEKYPIVRGCEVWSAHCLPQWEATQIGSAPFFIQRSDNQISGKVICTIASVSPMHDQPFPWINRRKPIPLESFISSHNDGYFTFADTGCIYISIDDQRQLHWRASSY